MDAGIAFVVYICGHVTDTREVQQPVNNESEIIIMSNLPEKENTEPPDSLEDTLKDAVESDDKQQVEEIVAAIPSQETLRQASLMKADERDQLISILEPEMAADLIEEAPTELAASMVEDLDSSVAAKILEELPTGTQADIVQDLGKKSADAILSAMDSGNAEDVRKLTRYDPDSAGGLMEPDAFTFFIDDTVGTVLQRLIKGDHEFERYRGQHPYILDNDCRLVGVVSLRDLLRNNRSVLLGDIMNPAISILPETSQDELAVLFHENPFLGIPVVDNLNVLLGVVSREHVTQAALERALQQSLHRQRASDELRSMPTHVRSRRRLAWLSSNIVLNIIAASVIAAYEETLAALIAIAVFLSLIHI